jgi:hypothetical protein
MAPSASSLDAEGRERLQHQMAAALLGDQRQLDGAETQSAALRRHRCREPAHVGKRLPGAARKAAATSRQLEPCGETIRLLEIARRAFLQQPLIVGETEVHRMRSVYSPNIVLAMMLRWISAVPP